MSVCILWQFIVSKALLISSATVQVIVRAGGGGPFGKTPLLWCYLVSSSLSSVKTVCKCCITGLGTNSFE